MPPEHPPLEPSSQTIGKNETIADPEPPYTTFGLAEKRFIIVLVAFAALFSPLSANIYYPALNVLATDLKVSISLINLTITTYLIFQGLAPTFIGSISDETGRRPSYIICFVIYLATNIGLALQNEYSALMVLRCIQSTGSSGTVALANAVVSDIYTSAERGTSISYVSMGAMVGPAFGPVIGGLLVQYLGWRAAFWFLAIFGGVVFVLLLLFLPETCRRVVGNGSVPAKKWNMSLLGYIRFRRLQRSATTSEEGARVTTRSRVILLRSIYILFEKESGALLVYAGLLFAGFYMVLASLPSQLESIYHFNPIQIGLCYLPAGCGSMTAAIVVGRILDWNFRRHAKRLGIEISNQRQQDLTHFPIEIARLQIVLPLLFLAVISVIAYGWVLDYKTSLAGPLVLLFFATFSMSGSFQGLSTLVVDLNRSNAGAATAAMNLARCELGAGAVSFVTPLINAIGVGWTCVLVAGVWTLISPMVLLIMRFGPGWREEKRLEEEKRTNEGNVNC